MQSIRSLLVVLLLCLSVSGCVEWISLQTSDMKMPVVQCVLQDSDKQTLALVWTAGNDESDDPEPIVDAIVTLSVMTNGSFQEVGRFERGDDGKWHILYHPIYGKSYQLTVQTGQHTLTARTVMPFVFHCEICPDPVLITLPNRTARHIHPSRRIISEGPDDTFPIMAWFTGEKGLVEELFTSQPRADSFNNCPDGVWLSYDDDKQPDCLLPYHKWLVSLSITREEKNPYHFSLTQLSSSTYSPVNIRSILKNHPEYGAFEQEGMVVGPDLDFWPRNPEEASTLHLICPSPEMASYLKSIIGSLTTDHGDFNSIYSQESPYTNIEGGKGIFGAVTEWDEDYRDYDSKMIEYYRVLYNNERERQQ